MSEAPAEVRRLADRRGVARAKRDFAAADSLRAEIAELGWVVRDGPDGFTLQPRPPYEVLPDVSALPDRSGRPDDRRCTVGLLAEGWPDDLRTCVEALIAHAPPDVTVSLLDLGDVDGCGSLVHELAATNTERVAEWHVERPAGWGAARAALLRADTAAVHVLVDPSTVLTGDALGPLLAALEERGVVGAGWRGVNADLDNNWRSFADAGPGEVDALLGYLFAVRRDAALAVSGPSAKARSYRNADIEFSLMLREAGGRLVVPGGEFPVTQGRHHGYHDTDPDQLARESKRTYDRILARFRGRKDILAPR